jgi:hypothetical protein
VSHNAWFVSGWLAFVGVLGVHAFLSSPTSSHAATGTRRACGASSSSLSGASTQAAKGSAHISLNTAQGVAGTQVVVSGTSWPVAQEVFISVENLIDERGGVNSTGRLVTANVNVYGGFTTPAFSFPYAVCGVRPKDGTTASIVATTDDNSVRVVKPFALAQTPTLAVASPQQLSPLPLGASSISVVGSDWAPGSTVSLVAAHLDMIVEADGNQRQTATLLPGAQTVHATADARGALIANVPIPSGLAPGTVINLSATAISARYGTLLIILDPGALVPAPVAPTWDLSANRGEPGRKVSVTGEHWWPTDFVSVEYCRAEAAQPTALGMRCNLGPQGLAPTGYAAQLGRAVVDGNGYFSATITLPANAKPGAIIVQARLTDGNTRAGIYFASQEFTLTTPAPSAASLLSRWRDWSPEAIAVVLLIGAMLFVFWPHIMLAIGRRPAPAALADLANPTTVPLEGDDDDE